MPVAAAYASSSPHPMSNPDRTIPRLAAPYEIASGLERGQPSSRRRRDDLVVILEQGERAAHVRSGHRRPVDVS